MASRPAGSRRRRPFTISVSIVYKRTRRPVLEPMFGQSKFWAPTSRDGGAAVAVTHCPCPACAGGVGAGVGAVVVATASLAIVLVCLSRRRALSCSCSLAGV